MPNGAISVNVEREKGLRRIILSVTNNGSETLPPTPYTITVERLSGSAQQTVAQDTIQAEAILPGEVWHCSFESKAIKEGLFLKHAVLIEGDGNRAAYIVGHSYVMPAGSGTTAATKFAQYVDQKGYYLFSLAAALVLWGLARLAVGDSGGAHLSQAIRFGGLIFLGIPTLAFLSFGYIIPQLYVSLANSGPDATGTVTPTGQVYITVHRRYYYDPDKYVSYGRAVGGLLWGFFVIIELLIYLLICRPAILATALAELDPIRLYYAVFAEIRDYHFLVSFGRYPNLNIVLFVLDLILLAGIPILPAVAVYYIKQLRKPFFQIFNGCLVAFLLSQVPFVLGLLGAWLFKA
jgi:hypothetical protein